MNFFLTFVEFLVAIGIVVTLVTNYLIINKLWKRRMVREVAESVSIAAALLGLFNGIPFLIMFLLINPNPAAATKTTIGIVTAVIFVLIGSGLWVAEFRQRGFRSLFLRALNLERKESADLIKRLVQPRGATQILRVLQELASVDGHVDERETEIIRHFAREWRLEMPDVAGDGAQRGMIGLRKAITDYLNLNPPAKQVADLRDVLQALVESDAQVAWQESVALEEVDGMLARYTAGDDAGVAMHEVLIVPQSDAQVEAVRTLLPGREEKFVRGGRVFSVGSFFSARYAEFVCERYISLGLFTTVVAEDQAVGGQ
ncbi:TerB family tellurite resistance protein [Wenzhouxiangella sp. XN24]|uniref:tellurite resistance TerB family protein n=1 Tax=Wenzhouxiangella sp. XN24 TaxID=2713569 RepID=UPI0013ED7332|nr:TerB family tellurite resistance protein [Wenzhouxiangella sp. XN24]NGX15811.1 TerB family tellurite resistance protein [Wenzhouxiangella sp. XN24]